MWVAHVPCLLGPVRGHVENDRPHGPAWKVVQLFDYYYSEKVLPSVQNLSDSFFDNYFELDLVIISLLPNSSKT
jgi:hypothetical protein